MSFIKFAYNRSVFSTIKFSSFKIMYGFNSLTLLNLLFLYIDKRVSFDENNQRFAYQDTSFPKKFKWFFVIFFLIYNLTTKVLLIKKKMSQ